MTSIRFVQSQPEPARPEFRQGDDVVLASGACEGTIGVFLSLRDDVDWADITESNGAITSHPVVYLARGNGAGGVPRN